MSNRLVPPPVLTLFASDISSENKTADGQRTGKKKLREGEREETSARFSSVLPSVRERRGDRKVSVRRPLAHPFSHSERARAAAAAEGVTEVERKQSNGEGD